MGHRSEEFKKKFFGLSDFYAGGEKKVCEKKITFFGGIECRSPTDISGVLEKPGCWLQDNLPFFNFFRRI